MFYDKNLMNSETLGSVWKISYNIHAENMEKCNLPNICNELDSWVGSEAPVTHRRLSLRASSNLIAGAAKLYKHGMDKLYNDIVKVEEDIIFRHKRGHNSSSPSESNDSSESLVTPEPMRRQATMGFDSSFSPTKRRRNETISPVKITPMLSISRSFSESPTDDKVNSNEEASNGRSFHNNCDLDPENMERTSKSSSDLNSDVVEEPVSEEKSPENHRHDRGVQTSPILFSRHKSTKRNSRLEHGFDPQLPFAYILIHDSYGSRIPSKIIFTSINSNVNHII